MSTIQFKDFSFQYDNLKNPTLKNINIEIKSGEKVLIAGPSGSGKSTLGHCINGLIPFAYEGKITGELFVGGEPTKGSSLDAMSKRVGTILQDSDGQFVALSVGEDVAFAFENSNVAKQEMVGRVQDILGVLDMEDYEGYSPYNLSGGQKQKVAMAGVLAMEAPILLFDEPLANLDPVSGRKAMETIDYLHRETHKTILVIEHRIEDVLAYGFDRIIIINKGEVVFNGEPNEALRTGILCDYGLREPLYIETLKNFGVDLSQDEHLTELKSLSRYSTYMQQQLAVVSLQEKQEAQPHTLIEAKDIHFRYFKDEEWILKDVSFKINAGEFLAILGNNGAGKSTLLKVLTGFCKPEEGSILFEGKDITKSSIKKRSAMIGYVMQNPNHMITKYMIFDEIAFGLRNFGIPESEITKRVEEVLEICGLSQFKNWPIASLSFGQKKRVTIASILALKPRVIVLDEPTAGQDHKNYTEFMGFLHKLRSEGVTVVMITHDIQLALEYADRGVVLSKGQVLMDDSIYKVLSKEDVLKKANLREPSISELGVVLGMNEKSVLLEKAILKGRAVKDE